MSRYIFIFSSINGCRWELLLDIPTRGIESTLPTVDFRSVLTRKAVKGPLPRVRVTTTTAIMAEVAAQLFKVVYKSSSG